MRGKIAQPGLFGGIVNLRLAWVAFQDIPHLQVAAAIPIGIFLVGGDPEFFGKVPFPSESANWLDLSSDARIVYR